jgi:hypothetical protein
MAVAVAMLVTMLLVMVVDMSSMQDKSTNYG